MEESEGGGKKEQHCRQKKKKKRNLLPVTLVTKYPVSLSFALSIFACARHSASASLPPFAMLPFETHTGCMPRVPRQHAPLLSCFTLPCLPRPPPVIDKGSSVVRGRGVGDVWGKKGRRGGIIRVIFLGKARFRTHGLPCASSGEDVASAATQDPQLFSPRSCFSYKGAFDWCQGRSFFSIDRWRPPLWNSSLAEKKNKNESCPLWRHR